MNGRRLAELFGDAPPENWRASRTWAPLLFAALYMAGLLLAAAQEAARRGRRMPR